MLGFYTVHLVSRITLYPTVACNLCRTLVRRSKTSFASSWPSVIWTYLEDNRKDTNIVKKILRIITPVMFLQWAPSSSNMSETAREYFENEQIVSTMDRTFDFETFARIRGNPRKHMRQGKWEKFLSQVPFEDVRCPAGCHRFVDDVSLRAISVKHYIAKIDSSFTSFDAKGIYLKGARPDWPNSTWSLFGVQAFPTIIRNNRLDGLSFLLCGKDHHPMERTSFVHVPLNPCLKVPLNETCTHAPIVMTSHVVRREQLHRYNASFRVVRQFGNSSGLATVTLSRKCNEWIPLTKEMFDIASTTIACRSDIRQHVSRTLSSDQVSQFVDNYRFMKEEHSSRFEACRQSGTYIDIPDSIQETTGHLIGANEDELRPIADNEQVDVRTRDKANDVEVFVRNCASSDQTGKGISCEHLEFPNVDVQHRTRGIKTHLMCMALGNCRSLHRSVVSGGLWKMDKIPKDHRIALERVGRIIRRSMKGIVAFGNNRDKDIIAAEQNISVQPETRHGGRYVLTTNPDQMTILEDVSKFLSTYGNGRILSLAHIPSDADLLSDLPNGTENIICSKKRVNDGPFRLVPKEIGAGKFHLMFAANILRFGRNGKYSSSIFTRWNKEESWTGFEDGRITSTAVRETEGTIRGCFNFLIYARVSPTEMYDEYTRFNWMGGQTSITCKLHPFPPLIREPNNPSDWVQCSWPGCRCHGIWRCIERIDCRPSQCATSICRRHFKEVLNSRQTVSLCPSSSRQTREPSSLGGALASDVESEDEEIGYNSDTSDEDTRKDVEFVNEFSHVEENLVEMHDNQSIDAQPVFIPPSNDNQRIRSSYILNNMYQVMGRFGISRRSPIALQRLLQGIYASHPENRISTLYLEGQLFPWIFPFDVDGAVVGALPHSFYINPLNQKRQKGVATLMDHMRVRIMDGSLLTASEPDYLSWAFDVIMNYVANFNTVEMSLRKGPEFLLRKRESDGLNVGQKEGGMMFDAVESRGPVNELAALVRERGKWDYFVTLTCNDEYTPGVSALNRHIRAYAKHYSSDPKEQMKVYTAGMPAMLRAWHRFVSYFWLWVVEGPDHPLGHVKSLWYRYEFQDSGAPGNKPHVHGGVTLDENYNESEMKKAQRVTAHDLEYISSYKGYELRDCMEKEIVESAQEYVELRDFIRRVQTHECALARYRCMKRVDENGQLRCRVPRQGLRPYPEFIEADNLYGEETLEYLHAVGLADRDVESSELVPHPELRGGKWYYPSPGGSFLPTVPSIAWSVRASTNVQKCDRKFLMGYLLKYNAGKDEKAQVRFLARPDSDEIRKESTGFRNIKITSQKIYAKKEDSKFGPIAREIGLPEMAFVLSDLEYVHSTVQFVHVPTFPPEHRMAIRKRQCRSKRVSSDGTLQVKYV